MSTKTGSSRRTETPRDYSERRRMGPIQAVASDRFTAAAHLCQIATAPRESGVHVHLVNAFTVASAHKDPALAATLGGDSINLPDGKPLTWVSRLRRDRVPLSQVRGPQFFLDVFDMGRSAGVRHFLLGSTDEVLTKLQANLLAAYPGATIVGAHSPPFRALSEDELEQQDAAIMHAGAHVVWVGLGTPKQDYEARRLAGSIPVVAVAVGAAFDFAAGTVKEAPPIYVKLGLEWVYRFAKEPRRLWRRYVFGNFRFLRAVAHQGERPSRHDV